MNPPTITNLPFPDLDLIFVEGGEFMMGDEKGDLWEACRPVHPIKVSSLVGKPLYLSISILPFPNFIHPNPPLHRLPIPHILRIQMYFYLCGNEWV